MTEKTYHEKVQQIKEEVKSDSEKIKNKQIFKLNDFEDDWASQTYHLLSDEVFKKYLELESKIIYESVMNSYSNPKETFMNDSCTFGEKMAFNKGFHFGLLKMKQMRDVIWNVYLNAKTERKKDET